MPKRASRPRATPAACPCHSGRLYVECCGPAHAGSQPVADCVALVRARFCAYALGRFDYLWETLHADHDDRVRGRDAFIARLERSAPGTRYTGLRILDVAEPDAHGIARVLFSASIAQHKRDLSVVEQSDFVQEDGQWRYIVGVTRLRSQLGHDLSEMQIDHWQCDHHHH